MPPLTPPPRIIGETTLTSKNQISLPARSVRELGWERGDRLIVEVIAPGMVVLLRRPESFTEALAGRLTDVFGTHEETLRWLDEERSRWHTEEPG
jgi:bifunctional DNA-binding transcriptional regulator/antitoxin component of YhaV-PrlF toxin-antitoxin module